MLLKYFYICGLACGLVPAPLNNKQFSKASRTYLIYTACLHGLLLVLLPFTFPKYMYDASYMRRNLVLQWAFSLTNITRIMAMVSGFFLTWGKRKKLMALEKALLAHCLEGMELEEDSSGFSKLRRRIRGLLLHQFVLLNLTLVVSTLLLMRIDTDQEFNYLLMILVHILQFTYIVIMTAALHVILSLLFWQQERVNLTLQDLYSALNHKERNSLSLSPTIATESVQVLRNLFQLHSENRRLLRQILKVLDIPIAMLLLKMFVTNINLVYHGVQFGNHSIETTILTKILGQLVVFSHYWSAILLMNIVNDVTQASGPKTGHILKQFSHLELVKRDFQLELELFSDHLRCHPATYKVCGLFVLSKQTSLVYFFFVLVQVLVLIQFDMKTK
ncbi:hypothetical protein KR074_009303 [Drosophila pseudoananassae]|nr:hypothetical protein KR074_009303 [Drosophila pseudoananassae]